MPQQWLYIFFRFLSYYWMSQTTNFIVTAYFKISSISKIVWIIAMFSYVFIPVFKRKTLEVSGLGYVLVILVCRGWK